jgi:PII-like signaling protein
MAGFGQLHVMHEAKFFELAGSLAIEVQFIVTDEEASSILSLLRAEKISVLYVKTPATFGSTDEPA